MRTEGTVVAFENRSPRLTRLLVAALLLAASVGCAAVHLDPVTDEEFDVTPVSDPSRTLTFREPMVWSNAPQHRATKGVRLLDGTYVLEAENDDFLYFRAPSPVELRVLEKGVPVDGQDLQGGLALAKAAFSIIPAAAYVSISENRKMHVMKMGNDFLQLEGRGWEKSF